MGPKLRWLERHEPDVVRRARRVAGSYDWVAGRLAGVAFNERNWALESGLYDLQAADFADDLLAAAGWDRERLAPIRDPADVVGGVTAETAAATGLRAGTPVVAGLADHVASAFGAGLAAHGDVLVKLGGLGRRAGRLGPPAGRRAPVPRRAPGARPVAAERLHGERRLGHPLVPARARRRRRRSRSSTARPPPRPPGPTGS